MTAIAIAYGHQPRTTSGAPFEFARAIAQSMWPFNLVKQSTRAASTELYPDPSTRATPSFVIDDSSDVIAPQIHRLRRISGLTWEELSRALNVSRRTAHNWANGEAVKPQNAEHVRKCLEAIERIAQSGGAATRLSLLASNGEMGLRPIDLLNASLYDAAIVAALAGSITSPPVINIPPVLHPSAYLEALGDGVIPATGRARPGKALSMTRKR